MQRKEGAFFQAPTLPSHFWVPLLPFCFKCFLLTFSSSRAEEKKKKNHRKEKKMQKKEGAFNGGKTSPYPKNLC
jgi:hypothetical protein